MLGLELGLGLRLGLRSGLRLGLEHFFERRSGDRTRVDGICVRVRVRVRGHLRYPRSSLFYCSVWCMKSALSCLIIAKSLFCTGCDAPAVRVRVRVRVKREG